MLVIRQEQLNVFKQLAWKAFEDEMLAHLREYFPLDHQLLGEEQTRKGIQRGLERADSYGITSKGEVCRYLNLTFALGGGFDDDPQLPWARAALTAPLESAGSRMSVLQRHALAYLERVSGPHGEYFLRAVSRARALSFEELTSAPGDLEQSLGDVLQRIHEEKYRELQGPPMSAFLRLATLGSEQAGLTSPGARVVYTVLMFLFGSHFAEDPYFPWAEELVKLPHPNGPEHKARALHERAQAHLDQVLTLLDARRLS